MVPTACISLARSKCAKVLAPNCLSCDMLHRLPLPGGRAIVGLIEWLIRVEQTAQQIGCGALLVQHDVRVDFHRGSDDRMPQNVLSGFWMHAWAAKKLPQASQRLWSRMVAGKPAPPTAPCTRGASCMAEWAVRSWPETPDGGRAIRRRSAGGRPRAADAPLIRGAAHREAASVGFSSGDNRGWCGRHSEGRRHPAPCVAKVRSSLAAVRVWTGGRSPSSFRSVLPSAAVCSIDSSVYSSDQASISRPAVEAVHRTQFDCGVAA